MPQTASYGSKPKKKVSRVGAAKKRLSASSKSKVAGRLSRSTSKKSSAKKSSAKSKSRVTH